MPKPSLLTPPPCKVPGFVVNQEEAPPVGIPESLPLRGFNTRGWIRANYALSEQGHALRYKIDASSNEYLASHGCSVVGRHSAQGTGLKGAISTVEHEAFAANYKGVTKLIADVYGVPLEEYSFCLPSLADGMIRSTDIVLINVVKGTNQPLFTTIDLLCVNPKVCFEGPRGSLYSQLVKKERAFLREDPAKISRRLDDQAYAEQVLYQADPERYPDGEVNAEAIDCLKQPLSAALDKSAHLVLLDTVCGPSQHAEIVRGLTEKLEGEGNSESLVVKAVGAPRCGPYTTLEGVNNKMADGHQHCFEPVNSLTLPD